MIQFVKRSRGETEKKSHKPSLDAHKTRVPRNERVRIILVRLRFQEVRLEFRLRGAESGTPRSLALPSIPCLQDFRAQLCRIPAWLYIHM